VDKNGQLIGVVDVDSDKLASFGDMDKAALEKLMEQVFSL
jgi:putative methionine-R-sulfoxide reductase with GAF domain